MPFRCLFLLFHVFLIPRIVPISCPEFAILSGKILMMHVKPVVSRQNAVQNLVIVDYIVRNFSVCQNQSNGIVPRKDVFRGIYRQTRHFLKLHLVHVHARVGYFSKNTLCLNVGDNLIRDVSELAFAFKHVVIRHQVASAFIIEQPANLHLTLQHPICHSVRLQVVGLSLVHRNQDVGGEDFRYRQHYDYQKNNISFNIFHLY